jgi:FAD-dependent urate hydroxylase
VSKIAVAIIGAGPYGLSLATHLAARKVEHRIFGHPMLFWSQIADAGGERYLKSYCFGADLSTPCFGFTFADYSGPRGLETFEPCSMSNFAAYGRWFQQSNVPWVEPIEVAQIERRNGEFVLTLADGKRLAAKQVVVATGLARFAHVPKVLASLPPALVTHTSKITSFASFKGLKVAVIGAGQSALEAAALLHEADALPELLVRKNAILWQHRVSRERGLWRRLRSPISGLGTGPKAWALTRVPGAVHRMPASWRTRFVKRHLPPEGAWWLRARVENRIPVHFGTTVIEARETAGRVALRVRSAQNGNEHQVVIDHVIAGSGYDVNVDHLDFIHPTLRRVIQRIEGAPRLNDTFEASIPGLRFIGPASAMSFGPLFRFVVGAKYTAQIVSQYLASQVLQPA